ncbi:hypothetical protein HY031_02085 [Candidatus Gottesmanbacteria bacterium]|nr:hypothetical protein [Candidatus Gottesmanbacteria bacterium]
MRKIVITVVIIGVVAGSIGGVLFFRSQSARSTISRSPAEPTPMPVKLLTWTDPAGFTFQYPEGLSVNKHDEDQENYAHVELTKAGQAGNIIVWAKDPPLLSGGSTASDAAGWIKSDKRYVLAASIDTTLGNQPAKKIVLTDQKKGLVGTIFDDTLWLVETDLASGDYWQKTADTIIGSFAFKPVSSSPAGGDTGSGGGAVDEEEVVQ